jgi:iron complex outermembrane receptor protein
MPFFDAIQPPLAEPVAALESVIVSASRSQTRLDEMPLHTTVLDQQDIAASSAQTLDQLLRNIAGLNFAGVPATQSDPTGHQTKMRGLGNAKVLVLLDGVPVHDPFYLTTQWFKLPLARIARIEVVRGGGSSLWGNMAVAGVINVITRRVTVSGVELDMSAGSWGSHTAAATLDQVINEQLSVRLSADQLQSNGYQLTPTEHLWRFPQKNPTNARDSNVQLTTQWRSDAGLNAWLRLGYHVQDQDISYVYGNNLQRSPDAAAGLTQLFGNGSQLQANAWAQYVGFEKYNGASCYFQDSGTRCPSNANVTLNQVNSTVLQYYTQYGSLKYREQGGSLAYSLPLSGIWQSVQLGSDVRRLSATDNETFYAAPTVFAAPQGNLGSTTAGAGTQTFSGVFAQLKLQPLPSLMLLLSARQDSYRSTDRNNTRTTANGTLTGGPIADTSQSAFDPSASLRWTVMPNWDLRAAAYKAFRAPGFNNTMRTFGASTPTIANPELQPERLRAWELGSDVRIGALTLGATYFQYDIKNQIASFRVNSYATAPELVRSICSSGGGANLTLCGGSANFYTNDQDGRSKGLELEAAWVLDDALQVAAQYTHTSASLVRRGAVVTDPLGVQLVGTPMDVGALQLRWQATPDLQTQLSLRYIGRMPIDTTSVAGTAFYQGSNTVLDASFSYRYNKQLDVWLSGSNLLDRSYSENGYIYTQPFNRTLSAPRTLQLGLRLRLAAGSF